MSHDSTDEVLFGDVSSELYSTLSCSRLSSNFAIWLLKSECSIITISVTIWSIWDNFKVVKPSGLIHKCSEVFSKKVFKCVDKYLSSNPNQETSNNEDKWGLSKCSRIFHERRQRVQYASGHGGGEKRHRKHRQIAPGNYKRDQIFDFKPFTLANRSFQSLKYQSNFSVDKMQWLNLWSPDSFMKITASKGTNTVGYFFRNAIFVLRLPKALQQKRPGRFHRNSYSPWIRISNEVW